MLISEVSKKFDISPNALRYYERIGLIPNVKRNKSGIRDYDEIDCNWIEYIKYMREAGIPIEALIEYVTLYQQGNETFDARMELITEQRQIIEEKITRMQNTLARLDDKIKWLKEENEKGNLIDI